MGVEIARLGIKDENLIPVLHRLRGATFFTLDEDFYDYTLCHHSYCLVRLDILPKLSAFYIRRFLKHPAFDTETGRIGKVVQVRISGLEYLEVGMRRPKSLPWPKQ